MGKKILLLLFLLCFLCGIASADQTLYGMRSLDWGGTDLTSDLITIDPLTGALDTVIGTTGLQEVGGFAINPNDGTMYATGYTDSDGYGVFEIFSDTGAASYIGGDYNVQDMAFDREGTLYGILSDMDFDNPGALVTIDTWGEYSIIDSDFGSDFGLVTGLSFDTNNDLFVQSDDQLYTVNKSDGSILEASTLNRYLEGSLAIDSNNNFFSHYTGTDPDDPEMMDEVSQMVSINAETGEVSLLSETIPPLEDEWEKAYLTDIEFGLAVEDPPPDPEVTPYDPPDDIIFDPPPPDGDEVEGVVHVSYSNPLLHSNALTGEITTDGISEFWWGEAQEGSFSSGLVWYENPFQTDVGETFIAGYLGFFNGTVNLETGIDGLTLNFSAETSLGTFADSFFANIINTLNVEGDPVASADWLSIPELGLVNFGVEEGHFAIIAVLGEIGSLNITGLGDIVYGEEYGHVVYDNQAVPEPATMVLFGLGLLGLAGINRRKKCH